jgi:hypothetical protein
MAGPRSEKQAITPISAMTGLRSPKLVELRFYEAFRQLA